MIHILGPCFHGSCILCRFRCAHLNFPCEVGCTIDLSYHCEYTFRICGTADFTNALCCLHTSPFSPVFEKCLDMRKRKQVLNSYLSIVWRSHEITVKRQNCALCNKEEIWRCNLCVKMHLLSCMHACIHGPEILLERYFRVCYWT